MRAGVVEIVVRGLLLFSEIVTMSRFASRVFVAAAIALAVGCSGGDSTNRKDRDGSGGTPTPLLDLLAQLPKEHWPNGPDDTLKFDQAKKWYEKNLTGRRVTWSVPADREFKFESDKK